LFLIGSTQQPLHRLETDFPILSGEAIPLTVHQAERATSEGRASNDHDLFCVCVEPLHSVKN